MKSPEIKQLLPEILQKGIFEGSPLQALTDIMAYFHESIEEKLGGIDMQFDPRRTGAELVPFLAGWVDLQWLLRKTPLRHRENAERSALTDGLGRLRELIANTAYLSRWRGTTVCILRFLTTATGIENITIEEIVKDERGAVIPFHIRVVVPVAVQQHKELVELIELILRKEKPAYITYEIFYR